MLFPVDQRGARQRAASRARTSASRARRRCDYLSGAPFAFVQTLEATGAWPPISESHVEMDGAWALYEAWVRLQHGDIDTALVFASGMSSRCDMREVLAVQLDPYYLMPLWADHVSLAALQAQRADRRRQGDRGRLRRGRARVGTTATRTSSSRCASRTSRRTPTAPRA